MKYSLRKTRSGFSSRKKIIILSGLAAAVIIFGGAGMVRKAYSDNLKPRDSSDNSKIIITIEPGSVPSEIARTLESKGVIRSDWALEWYVRNNNFRDELKAGTYIFMPSQSVQQIVEKIISGDVAKDLVTILPGKRLDEIKQGLVEAGFRKRDVDTALNPAQYRSHPALSDLPKGATLEGYLYPESFQKVSNTTAGEIIEKSLNEMARYLTPEVRRGFSQQKLNVHQAVILASLIELEVSREEDKALVAQVFLKRYREGIKLQSNATDKYAKLNPDYNTYKIDGLPPGPISNVSESSLLAVAFPAQTDWSYFVSGDDGRTHFSKTLAEHEALTKKYCTKLCN